VYNQQSPTSILSSSAQRYYKPKAERDQGRSHTNKELRCELFKGKVFGCLWIFAIEHFLPDFHPRAISVHLEEHLQFMPVREILGRLNLRNTYNSCQDLMTAQHVGGTLVMPRSSSHWLAMARRGAGRQHGMLR
jgi:hypothetical protein